MSDYVPPLLLLMILSAIFSSSETAFACVNKARLKRMADDGSKKAQITLKVAESYEKTLTAILIGNNIVNIGSSALATVMVTNIFGEKGALLSTIIMTLLVLTFCEVLPKSYAKSHADSMALTYSYVFYFFTKLMFPFVFIFDLMSRTFKPKTIAPTVTEDELKYIIDEIEDQGVLEEKESHLVISALTLDEITVDQILTPRIKVVGVSKDATIEEIKNNFLENSYSRLPVFDETIDNIIGMITNKDFFKLLNGKEKDLKSIIKDVLYVPSTKLISEILERMQHTKTHLAIVVDQHGGTKGIVTLEDIVEQLVGEIYDETDEIIIEFSKIAPHKYVIDGSCYLNEVFEQMEEEDLLDKEPDTETTTIAGWLMELFGSIPQPNETIEFDKFKFKILEADNHYIKKVELDVEQINSIVSVEQ